CVAVPEVTLTEQHLTDGSYETTAPRPADGEDVTVSATITDQAGNTSAAGSDSATVGDTTATSAPVVKITTDGDDDGTLSNTELGDEATVAVTIELPPEAVAGDKLNITINGV